MINAADQPYSPALFELTILREDFAYLDSLLRTEANDLLEDFDIALDPNDPDDRRRLADICFEDGVLDHNDLMQLDIIEEEDRQPHFTSPEVRAVHVVH